MREISATRDALSVTSAETGLFRKRSRQEAGEACGEVSTLVNVLVGPNHRTQALARRMEKRGEIRVLWAGQRVSRLGLARVPYMRLRSRRQVRRERNLRLAGWGVVGFASAVTFVASIWEARVILVGGFSLAASGWYLTSRLRHRGACPGLHCPGCRS